MSQRPERIPDELVDAFFDRELPREQRRAFLSSLRGDGKRAGEVAGTHRALRMLRDVPAAPDQTAAILARVHRRRRFLPERVRRAVTLGRVLVAASLLMGIGTIALVQRYAPEATSLKAEPAYVSSVMNSGYDEASMGVEKVASALGNLSKQIAAPVARIASDAAHRAAAAPRRGERKIDTRLAMGDAAGTMPALKLEAASTGLAASGGASPFDPGALRYAGPWIRGRGVPEPDAVALGFAGLQPPPATGLSETTGRAFSPFGLPVGPRISLNFVFDADGWLKELRRADEGGGVKSFFDHVQPR